MKMSSTVLKTVFYENVLRCTNGGVPRYETSFLTFLGSQMALYEMSDNLNRVAKWLINYTSKISYHYEEKSDVFQLSL